MNFEEILENALEEMRSNNENYLQSFAMESDFRGKRFSRFVSKAKLNLFEYVKEHTPSFNRIYHNGPFKLTNIDDYFFANIVIYIHSLNDEYEHMKVLLHLFNLPQVPSVLITEKDLDEVKDVLSQGNLIYQLINDELANTYQEHIAYLSAKNSEVNEYNYVKLLLPFSDADNLKILNDAFFKMIVSLEHLILINQDYTSDLGEELLDSAKQIFQLVDEKEKLEEKIDEQTILITKLKNELQNKNQENRLIVKKKTEELLKENYELLKENDELKKKLKKRNTEKKCEKNEEIIEIEDKIKKNEREINDYRLLFIISDRCTFLKELQLTFPFAKITFKNYEMSIPKSDYVVIFTKYVNHTTYYHVKEICKQTNTKLIHCGNSNCEKVKELICEEINDD